MTRPTVSRSAAGQQARSDLPGSPLHAAAGERLRWMLDANAFDYLLDACIDPQAVRDRAELFITEVQHAELLAVPGRRRRQRLIGLLSTLDPTVRPAGAAEGARRDSKDRAIAATARRERCTVITDDQAFRDALLAEHEPALGCAEAFAELPKLAAPPGALPSGPAGAARSKPRRRRGRARALRG